MLVNKHEQPLHSLGVSSPQALLMVPVVTWGWSSDLDAENVQRATELVGVEYFGFDRDEFRELEPWFRHRPSEHQSRIALSELRKLAEDPREPTVHPGDVTEVLLLCETLARALDPHRTPDQRDLRTYPIVRRMAGDLGVDIGESWEAVLEELGNHVELQTDDRISIDTGEPKSRPTDDDSVARRLDRFPARAFRSVIRASGVRDASGVEPPHGLI